MTKMIGVIATLKEEIADFEKTLKKKKDKRIGRFNFCVGSSEATEIVLIRTGMGRKNVFLGTRYLLDRFPVEYVISIGFTGALHPELKIGDIIIAKNLSESALLHMVERIKINHNAIRRGDIASVNHILTSPQEKKELYQCTGALAVDMESSVVREEILKSGIPLLVVRSVSDTAYEFIQLFRFFHLRYQLAIAGRSLCNFLKVWFCRYPLAVL